MLSFDSLNLPAHACKSKRILICEAWNLTPHLETGLEIAIQLANSGSSIDYLHIGDIIPNFELQNHRGAGKREKLLGYWMTPQARASSVLNQLSNKLKLDIRVLDPADYRPYVYSSFKLDRNLHSLDQLLALTWSESPLFGISIVSTLASMIRDSEINLSEHIPLIEGLANIYISSFNIVSHLLASTSYSSLILFNGRLTSVKGMVAASTDASVPVLYHERGASSSRFVLQSYQTHDALKVQNHMLSQWNQNVHLEQTHSIANSFFHNQSAGKDTFWTNAAFNDANYSELSSIIMKARSCSPKQIVVAFFPSCDDEFLSVGDVFQGKKYEWIDQLEALSVLISIINELGFSLIVRNHPGLSSKSTRLQLQWDELQASDQIFDDVIFIPSTSSISSYHLLDGVDAVVSYGSTIGIEAVYRSKPSIIMCDAFYDSIGATVYQPTNIQELKETLKSIQDLLVVPESALPFGYHSMTNGHKYIYYQPDGLYDGTFCGHRFNHYPVTPLHSFLSHSKHYLRSCLSLFRYPSTIQ